MKLTNEQIKSLKDGWTALDYGVTDYENIIEEHEKKQFCLLAWDYLKDVIPQIILESESVES